MCGIAGLIGHYSADDMGARLAAMNAAIAHRGPDDAGVFQATLGDWRIGLGHRRLSIIDLSQGHQPMGNEDGRIQVVFNGEIYNYPELREALLAAGHRFATHSDTETIVHAYEEWGDDCVSRFRGMFAFALWDSRQGRVLLARDRFGKKPLFLRQQGDSLAFGSEIKALLALDEGRPAVDRQAVFDYLAYRYVPGPATLFAGIEKLPPAHLAVWQDGRLSCRRYASLPDAAPCEGSDPGPDPTGDFLARLDEAVRIRMISDVPFGAFLSGGIDSSAIVALMARHSSQRINTFSVGFAEAAYSELGYARDIARQFDTAHHELTVREDALIAHLPALTRFRDAPVAEPSDIPIYLLAGEAGKVVKMVLTGEGSDEILGGYPKHRFERYVPLYQALPGTLRHGLIEPLVQALPYRFRRAKTAVANLAQGRFADRMPRWFGALSPEERAALCCLSGRPTPDDAPQFAVQPGNSPLRNILYFDQASWLPDNLLERGDRMTMAASIEARMPFLDHRLAEYVSGLPDHLRVRGRTSKWILRDAMRRLLPAHILERPKVGFRVPVNEWFRGPLKGYLQDHLLGPDALTRDYFRREVLSARLEEHFSGRQNHEKLLWTLLTLELWHRAYQPAS